MIMGLNSVVKIGKDSTLVGMVNRFLVTIGKILPS